MMTREAKVGLMMVGVLVGVFGFLLYKREHRPSEGLASQTVKAETNESNSIEFPPDFSVDTPNYSTTNPPRRLDQLDQQAAGKDDFSDDQPQELTPSARQGHARLKFSKQVSQASNDDDFGQFEPPQKSGEQVQKPRFTEPDETVFDDIPTQKQPVRTVGFANDEGNSDPFEESPAATTQQANDFNNNDQNANTLSLPEVDSFKTTVQSPGERRVQEFEVQVQEPRRTRESDSASELNPRERRRAAPMTLSDDFAPSSRNDQSASPAHGPNYTIQPNDNFWIISRKRYGVGRYYMALAMHNQQIITDPKRMKPGIVISTPDAAILEQRYPQTIPKTAAESSPAAVTSTQSRKSADSESSGYFVTPDGVPMYRVGGHDTLSEIAKTHLGRTSRWVQILEMNRNVLRDGNDLKIGTVLRLPGDASRVRMAGMTEEAR